MHAREGRLTQSIIMPSPPIRVPNDGDRRLVGVAHTHFTLTAVLSFYRKVPDGVPVPLTTATVLPARPPTTLGLFLSVHLQTTVPFRIPPNRTPFLPGAIPNLHCRKWVLTTACLEKRVLSKVRLCLRHQPHSRRRLKLLQRHPLLRLIWFHGRFQKFFRLLPQ